jgi:Undecaprenyl-phosphate glucose phosphotransferase
MRTLLLPTDARVSPASERAHSVATPHVVGVVARAVDLLVIAASGVAATAIEAGTMAPGGEQLVAVALALLLGVNVFSLFQLYELQRLASLTVQLPRVVGAWCATLGGVLAVTFLLATSGELSRVWIVAWFAAGAVTLVASRFALKAWIEAVRRSGQLTRDVLVIGGSEEIAAFAQSLGREDHAARIVGRLDIAALLGGAPGAPALSAEGVRLLARQLRERAVDHVALALPVEHAAALPALVKVLRGFPVEVGFVPQLLCADLPVVGVRQVGGVPSVLLLKKPLEGWHWIVKTIEDRVLASAILLFIFPVMLAIAAAVRLSSPGPVLFRQKRHGFNQQMIEVLKFRTMYVDACDAPLSSQVVQATRDDPRVTPVGRFLRRTSLDELPQLFNVLRGEMSLVGPRPHAVAHDRHYAELIDGYLGRHRVKPGITGWAQVNGCRCPTKLLA